MESRQDPDENIWVKWIEKLSRQTFLPKNFCVDADQLMLTVTGSRPPWIESWKCCFHCGWRHQATEVNRRFIMRRCGAARGSGSACTTTHPLNSYSSRVKCAKQRCWINPTQLSVESGLSKEPMWCSIRTNCASTAQMSWGERCDCVRSRTL